MYASSVLVLAVPSEPCGKITPKQKIGKRGCGTVVLFATWDQNWESDTLGRTSSVVQQCALFGLSTFIEANIMSVACPVLTVLSSWTY